MQADGVSGENPVPPSAAVAEQAGQRRQQIGRVELLPRLHRAFRRGLVHQLRQQRRQGTQHGIGVLAGLGRQVIDDAGVQHGTELVGADGQVLPRAPP
ncbi:hypothetical protein G6F32_016132 [Rhizopus arrhizus]|nr:hypothetical protein G6F32_016132 [Rhizopus arrhizus]